MIHDTWPSLLPPTPSPIRFDQSLISKTNYCLALLPSMFWLKTIEHSRFTKGGNNFEMRRIYTCTELSMVVVEKTFGSDVVKRSGRWNVQTFKSSKSRFPVELPHFFLSLSVFIVSLWGQNPTAQFHLLIILLSFILFSFRVCYRRWWSGYLGESYGK